MLRLCLNIVLSMIQYARYVLECTLIICIERLHTWRLYLVSYFGHVFLLNIEYRLGQRTEGK